MVLNERSFLMRQLHLIAHGEPSDVIELNTVSEPALGQEDVLISMEAAPLARHHANSAAKTFFLMMAWMPQLPSTTCVTPKSTAMDIREIASSSVSPLVAIRNRLI